MSVLEARRTTLWEYHIHSIAYRLEREEQIHMLHRQSWLNQQVQATKGKGKHIRPVFESFDDFYDEERRYYMALKNESPKPTVEQNKVAEMNRRINSPEFNERVKLRAEEIRKQRKGENNE